MKFAPIKSIEKFPLDGSIRTLGWEIAAWIEDWLIQPDGDRAGEPFELTAEQLNFILWFYAVNAQGRFIYRRAVLRRAKGWGKSPFLGALCLAELVGPVVFDGWDVYGEPVGREHPSPWVVVAGVSETQTANTLDAIRAMCSAEFTEVFGLDVGITRIYVPGGKLVPITTNPATQEGSRPSFAVLDEVHHWTNTNGGKALARVIRRNLAKVMGRSVVTTNAHDPSQESVARDMYDAHLAQSEGRTKLRDTLYDSREAPGGIELIDEPTLRALLVCAYGDATWVDLDALISEVYAPDTPVEDARRFYLNQIVAAADAWVRPDVWDANGPNGAGASMAPLKRGNHGSWQQGDRVALGFDGGRTDDSSALVCVRISDGAAFLLGLWEKPEGPAGFGWEVDKTLVRGAVDEAFATLDVVAFFSDVAEWETDVDDWRVTYGERLKVKASTRHAVAWDMRNHLKDATQAVEALHRAITDGEVPHDGDLRLRRHVQNARRRPGRYGVTFSKETRESPHKVDALAALVLARLARTNFLGVPSTGKVAGSLHRVTMRRRDDIFPDR